jgi:predicted amidophosphoribosyltransferase
MQLLPHALPRVQCHQRQAQRVGRRERDRVGYGGPLDPVDRRQQERERQERLTALRRRARSRNAFATPEPSLAGVTSASGVLESESGSVSLA